MHYYNHRRAASSTIPNQPAAFLNPHGELVGLILGKPMVLKLKLGRGSWGSHNAELMRFTQNVLGPGLFGVAMADAVEEQIIDVMRAHARLCARPDKFCPNGTLSKSKEQCGLQHERVQGADTAGERREAQTWHCTCVCWSTVRPHEQRADEHYEAWLHCNGARKGQVDCVPAEPWLLQYGKHD